MNHTTQSGKNDCIRFVITCHNKHMHIVFNRFKSRVLSKQTYPSNEITKAKLPQIHVQNHNMNFQGECLHQYFFMDYKNEIQLMYPDYKSKSKRFEIIDRLKKETGIKMLDYRLYK